MVSLPTNPSSFDGGKSTWPSTTTNANEMTMEQIDRVIGYMPTEQQKQLYKELAQCKTENMVSGIPLFIVICGSSYLMRKPFRIGPWKVPFYALLGVGTATLSTILFNSSCNKRVQEKLAEEFKRQQLGQQTPVAKHSEDAFVQPAEWGSIVPGQEQFDAPTMMSGTPAGGTNDGFT